MTTTTSSRTRTRRLIAGATAGLLAGTILTSTMATPAGAYFVPGSAAVSNGVLTIKLPPEIDNKLLVEPIGRGRYYFAGSKGTFTTGAGCQPRTIGVRTGYECTGLSSVVVYGGQQRDIVGLQLLELPVTIYGGAGNDLLAGSRTDSAIYGGDGDDMLFTNTVGEACELPRASHGGNNLLDGGAGNDAFSGGAGADEFRGGSGLDVLGYKCQYFGSTAPDVSITLDGQANDGARGEGDNVHADIERLAGSAGNDHLSAAGVVPPGTGPATGPGTPLPATFGYEMHGFDGNDTLIGSSADDLLYGGDGSDLLTGGAGDDLLDGALAWESSGSARDKAWGDAGQDTCRNVAAKVSCEL